MGIWAGSTLNSNETSHLINQWDDSKSLAICRRKNGFLYEILGKAEPGATPMSVEWKNSTKVSGKDIQFNFLGSLKTISTVADGYAAGAGETGTWGGTVIPADTFGAVTLPIVHFADAEYFPSSELDRFTGQEQPMRDWIEEKLEYLMLSWENSFGNAFNTGTAAVPTRTQVCPWRHQISDGVSTGETTYVTYGLDRNDSGNVDFRGNVTVSVGDLTLEKIRLRELEVIERGGMVRLGLVENALYNKIHKLLEGYSVVTYDDQWTKFGGSFVKFGNIRWIMETRMPTELVGLIDPTTWKIWQKKGQFTRQGIVPDPSKKATHVLNWEKWIAIYCKAPNRNALMTNVTS